MNTKALLVVCLVLLLAVGGYFGVQKGLFAIGDTYTLERDAYSRTDFYKSGGASSDRYSWKVYEDCTPNAVTGYWEIKANHYYDNEYTDVASTNTQLYGNIHQFSKDLYILKDSYIVTPNRPRQHPDCAQIIKEFAESANVNITQVITIVNTVNQTVVQTIYVNDTIYICSGGELTTDPSTCETPVVVAKEKTLWDSVLDWFRKLYGGS